MGWEKPEKKVLGFSFVYYFLSQSSCLVLLNAQITFCLNLKLNNHLIVENVTEGLKIALWGFFKKVVIANHLAANSDPSLF